MRVRALLPLLPYLVLLAAACGGDDSAAGPAPGGGASRKDLADLAGDWVLDRERYSADLLAATRERVSGTLGKMPPKEAQGWEKLREHLVEVDASGTTLTLHLEADGTFSVDGVFGAIPGKTEGVAKAALGTWERDGAAILLTTVRQDGMRLDEPETIRGTVSEGRLTLAPSGGVSLVFSRERR